ncbi:MAG TPA: DUF4197 domain-containing protein [Flavobacteriales bacterium]|nr:DUF4197 domain-containing protein [Flavobacteriales bacterium]|tara:strand:+ start:11334 stop:12059 length:726 start_codon:yes stop_codon:yes gene_type:complete
MKKTKIIFISFSILALSSCTELEQVVNDTLNSTTQTSNPLTNEEVIKGLKEALTIGTQNATKVVSQIDGFNKNPKIRIPFPPEAQKVKEKVIALGMQDQVDKFELTLNRAAEEAAKEAAPIFIDAVKNMSISDGFAILKGDSTAATEYLREKTSAQLKVKFKPVIHNAIEKVEVTKYWNPIITTYNKIPFVEKMNPDLEEYVTQKAMDGLFLMLAQEEAKIRKDPAARVTDLLKRVFGNQG